MLWAGAMMRTPPEEWRNRLACWLFGVLCGAIPLMTVVVDEYHDAHADMREYVQVINEIRGIQRRSITHLQAIEQRAYRRHKQMAPDDVVDERPGDWRELVASILRKRD